MPQWSEEIFTKKSQSSFKYKKIENIKGFKILFAGNIGVAQDFNTIIRAMNEIKNHNIHLVVLGEGRAKKDALKKVKKYHLENCISFLGSFPLETMPYFFNQSDALLISLKKSEIFSKTIPSKTQPYMSSGKPILTNADGEVSEIINEANCGITSGSGDYITLSKNMLTLSKLSKEELGQMSKRGKDYYERNFKREDILMNLEKTFSKLLAK